MSKYIISELAVHSFHPSVAIDIGINAAVLFYNICFWVGQNTANERNYVNGKYWTYNSASAYTRLFPEFSQKQIYTALRKLEDQGYIESGCFNDDPYDRTKWYTVTEKFSRFVPVGKMDATCEHNVNNIYINIDNNSDNKLSNDSHKKDAFDKSNGRMDALKPKGYKGDGEKYNNKNNYTDKQLVAHITHTINSIMRNEYLISEDEEAGELNSCAELKKIILYFYREYNKTFAEKHPILSDISYGNIADRYMNPSGRKMSEDGVKDFATYKEMIDRYFATDFGRYKGTPENFNYRLSHFMSDNVRENLYAKMI